MEIIQLTIDESLLAEVQQATTALQMTPSDFMKVALERALQQREIIAKEREHAQGYLEQPKTSEEIEEWQSEQDWGEPLELGKQRNARQRLEGLNDAGKLR